MIESPSPRYFAASNSCKGFCSYYGDIFTEDRVDRLYIVKGGPGTGKSHFMKVIAARARGRGWQVTEYACSSDPSSLDGLILEKEGSPSVGFLDGTPPHPREPTLPGVKEELVNLGAFWNQRSLLEQRDEICRLAEEKSKAYRRAYAYLEACGAVDRAMELRMDGCVREDRIQALAERLLRGQRNERGRERAFAPIPGIRRAIGMTGEVCLPTLQREASLRGGSVLILADYYGIAYRVMDAVLARSREAGHRLYISYDPIYPHKIDGLYYPESGLCILAGRGGEDVPMEGDVLSRSIPTRRLAVAEAMREARGDVRRACALREQLTEAALCELSSAATHHFELERIYAEAMDFKAKEAFTEAFCEELFRM